MCLLRAGLLNLDDEDEEAARERRRRARQERLRNMENEEMSNTAREVNSTDRYSVVRVNTANWYSFIQQC